MMLINFLGHAGFALKFNGFQILVDPWLTPSSIDMPVLASFLAKHKSIDYLIPEPTHSRDEFNPDVILLSHHHAHHSPRADIEHWLSVSKKRVTVVSPVIGGNYRRPDFDQIMSHFSKLHDFIFVDSDRELDIGPFQIRALTHTVPFHLAYFVKCASGSFLHIADAKANRLAWDRRLDPIWIRYTELAPSYLALTGGAMSARLENDEGKFISENVFMSPVEAANLCRTIAPKAASIVGIFNSSVWKNRNEFGFSSEEVESYFSWALRHIAPKVGSILCRPGLSVRIQNSQISIGISDDADRT